ncbi:phosphoglycolate phosphatase [Chlorella sorokiniana]|uniref:Phosphoglycolate phosphatase n=1 Tax=Chlorella sorokiniana TaxID=3076 RepID=A0A2P6TSC7_CHLSO|nr:phosphoglycolate phosphatase [Chlorella sorokiniana]|eukprot:PRW56967.1 phosphoglycolate phosphatase [Chlorella sorokiniana]
MTVAAAAQAARTGTPAATGPTATAAPAAMAVRLTHRDTQHLDELLDRVSTIILDQDGVLWRGSTLLPGTAEALEELRRRGKRLLFLTNNSSRSRAQYRRKFEALGLEVQPEEIVPASYAAAAYLQSIGFSQRVFLIGNEGVAEELEAAGIDYVTLEQLCAEAAGSSSSNGSGSGSNGVASSAAALQQQWTAETFANLQLDPSIGAVVIGWDPAFSYTKVCYASACLREIPGCHFVATNLDSADAMGNGRFMPGTGCSVHAVETAVERRAVNVGKGGDWLLPFLCDKYGLRPEEALIVGDRLDTDVALGRAGGLLTVLPMTGVTTEAKLAAAELGELPHYVVPNLAALAGLDF